MKKGNGEDTGFVLITDERKQGAPKCVDKRSEARRIAHNSKSLVVKSKSFWFKERRQSYSRFFPADYLQAPVRVSLINVHHAYRC